MTVTTPLGPVPHPVPDAHDANRPPIRWADVCAATDRPPHALMQWRAIAGVVETRLALWQHRAHRRRTRQTRP